MQAIKEKLSDMNAIRKAKAAAKEEEKAEKEYAKARVEVAHEVRMAREKEAEMDFHVAKAADKAALHEAKLSSHSHDEQKPPPSSYAATPDGGADLPATSRPPSATILDAQGNPISQ
ncbi:unnamed protein product [Cuscuta campestris]|uniref:Uncharacterized protein n=1 Tax=Cuscuta campestris TaxID=132261 RepID=A0A484N8D3_9ASTE|nr:unnamed protein product [Cuscuta campestris]